MPTIDGLNLAELEGLSESEQNIILRERLQATEKEKRQLVSTNVDLARAAPQTEVDTPAHSRKVSALEAGLAAAEQAVVAAKATATRERNSPGSLLKLGDALAHRNRIKFDLAQSQPVAPDQPEILTRSRAAQQMVDELERQVQQAKDRVASSRGSNAALVAFTAATAKKKQYLAELDKNHRQKLADRERKRLEGAR